MEKDRREKSRVNFKTQVVLSSGDSEIKADVHSRDISLKGLFVYTDQKLPIGALCEISISLTGTSIELSLRAAGRITRQDPKGLGITFDAVDLESYEHLKNILLYNAPDPDGMLKEIEQKRKG
ncbi:MAG: PilZ domain-containing protein [Pseudomonadota bacterium]